MNTTQRDAIANPATSLVIYNTTLNCLQVNLGTPASPKWECLGGDPSSNGSANVSAYDCNTGSTGSMRSGVPVSGVTQTVTATVVTPGTYFITASANGVTYFGSGAFAAAGSQDILLTAIGTPTSTGTFTYTLNTTPTCSFDVDVTNGTSGGTAAVTSWSCNTGSAGTLITGQTVSGVTQTVTADVATPGTYNISATNNGVTFEASGAFAGTGPQTVVLTAVGTPEADGTYSYVLNVSNGCNFNRTSISQPVVSSLDCGNATLTGTVLSGTPANGVFVTIPYTGGNGAAYNTQLISSTGVTGLVASLNSGTLANGNGNLIFSISGTANTSGNAFFALTFGGQSCTFAVLVETPAAVATLDCAGSTPAGTLEAGTPASGVTQTIPYTGGNGGIHGALSIASSGVTGLTATAPADTIASGNGSLELTITGTPITAGTATFNVTFGGSTCSFTRTVDVPMATVTGLDCGSATVSPEVINAPGVNSTATIPYTGGNGAAYPAGTGIASTGVTGLTATLQAGTLAVGAGNLTYTITGTPSGVGTANFSIAFGGQSCTLAVTVYGLSVFDCMNYTISQTPADRLENGTAYSGTVSIPYTSGNGLSYGAITVGPSNGLSLTRVAGTYAPGGGTVVYNISGTYTGTTGSFSTFTLAEGCTVNLGCGFDFTQVHTTGAVAPVNKTVTYGTVNTNLTGANKCWITRNLGAAQQATAPNDATEASAGWYWQFNRQQGYQFTTSRTPNTTWNSINENSNWTAANDPCAILLGVEWRLPTQTELTNADANGGWNSMVSAFNSVLKLHTAGRIIGATGQTLSGRGGVLPSGFINSSNQSSNENTSCLWVGFTVVQMEVLSKTEGKSVRCLRDY